MMVEEVRGPNEVERGLWEGRVCLRHGWTRLSVCVPVHDTHARAHTPQALLVRTGRRET